MAVVIGMLVGGAAALAQSTTTAPAGNPPPDWEKIRKAALSQTDKTLVQKWVVAQIDQIFSAEEPAGPALEFYKNVTGALRASGTAPQFKDTLSQIVIDAFTARYQQASGGDKKVSPLAPALVLTTLREMGPPAAALPVFQAVLADPAPAVRCQAMMGINSLQASLPPATRTTLVEPIRKAALSETSPLVLGRYYDFLIYVGNNPTQGQEVQIAQALIAILDARLTRVEKSGEWPVVADAEVVNWLAGKAGAGALSNDPTRKEIVRVAARLLADAAFACANEKLPQQVKQELERVVFLAEDPTDTDRKVLGLADLFKAKVSNGTVPSPTVTEAVLSTGSDQKAKITAAIAKWIGSDQTKGLLTDPFGLPIGLNIQRPAPTTTSAPAS